MQPGTHNFQRPRLISSCRLADLAATPEAEEDHSDDIHVRVESRWQLAPWRGAATAAPALSSRDRPSVGMLALRSRRECGRRGLSQHSNNSRHESRQSESTVRCGTAVISTVSSLLRTLLSADGFATYARQCPGNTWSGMPNHR